MEWGRDIKSAAGRKRARRFLRRHRVITPTGCWEWTGSTTSRGYGNLSVGGQNTYVHRLAADLWGLGIDAISADHDRMVLHECDNPPCFNPGHLYVGTAKDNARDRDRRRK